MTLRGCLRRPVTLPPSGLRRWLLRSMFDARGARGWARAVLFVVLVVLAVMLLMVLMRTLALALPAHLRQVLATVFHPPRAGGGYSPWFASVNELGLLACALGASSLMVWLDGRGLREVGLAPRRRLRDFAGGAAVGLVMITLLVAGLVITGGARLEPPVVSAGAALGWGLAWAAASLLVGLFEEIAFRGYLFVTLREDYGFSAASAVVAVLFTLAHGANPGENPLGVLTAGLASVLFCVGIRRTGALWWAIGCHAAWDWSENFLYGSADSGIHSIGRLLRLEPHGNRYLSGGTVGPEGSLLCFVVLLATILVVSRRAPRGVPVKSTS
jgi:membrane protease YdiL (CAAX protease family)